METGPAKTPPPHWFPAGLILQQLPSERRSAAQPGALRVPGNSQIWEGLAFMSLQLGQGGRERIAVPLGCWRAVEQSLGSLCFPGFSLGCVRLPRAANNKVQELLGEVWDKAPGAGGQVGRAAALLPSGVFKGHKEPWDSSGTEGSGPALTQTAPHQASSQAQAAHPARHPCKLC